MSLPSPPRSPSSRYQEFAARAVPIATTSASRCTIPLLHKVAIWCVILLFLLIQWVDFGFAVFMAAKYYSPRIVSVHKPGQCHFVRYNATFAQQHCGPASDVQLQLPARKGVAIGLAIAWLSSYIIAAFFLLTGSFSFSILKRPFERSFARLVFFVAFVALPPLPATVALLRDLFFGGGIDDPAVIGPIRPKSRALPSLSFAETLAYVTLPQHETKAMPFGVIHDLYIFQAFVFVVPMAEILTYSLLIAYDAAEGIVQEDIVAATLVACLSLSRCSLHGFRKFVHLPTSFFGVFTVIADISSAAFVLIVVLTSAVAYWRSRSAHFTTLDFLWFIKVGIIALGSMFGVNKTTGGAAGKQFCALIFSIAVCAPVLAFASEFVKLILVLVAVNERQNGVQVAHRFPINVFLMEWLKGDRAPHWSRFDFYFRTVTSPNLTRQEALIEKANEEQVPISPKLLRRFHFEPNRDLIAMTAALVVAGIFQGLSYFFPMLHVLFVDNNLLNHPWATVRNSDPTNGARKLLLILFGVWATATVLSVIFGIFVIRHCRFVQRQFSPIDHVDRALAVEDVLAVIDRFYSPSANAVLHTHILPCVVPFDVLDCVSEFLADVDIDYNELPLSQGPEIVRQASMDHDAIIFGEGSPSVVVEMRPWTNCGDSRGHVRVNDVQCSVRTSYDCDCQQDYRLMPPQPEK